MKSYVVGFALLIAIGGAGYYLSSKNAATSQEAVATPATEVTDDAAASANKATTPNAVTVVYTDKGFVPATLTVKLGQTVRFFNQSTGKMWVASTPNPTHADLPEFDENSSILNGQGWEFTFKKVGTFGYYNQMSDKMTGKVTVTAK